MSGSTFLFLKNVHSLVATLQEQKTRPSNEEIAQFADNVVHAYKEIFGGERGTDSNSQGSGSSVEGGGLATATFVISDDVIIAKRGDPDMHACETCMREKRSKNTMDGAHLIEKTGDEGTDIAEEKKIGKEPKDIIYDPSAKRFKTALRGLMEAGATAILVDMGGGADMEESQAALSVGDSEIEAEAHQVQESQH